MFANQLLAKVRFIGPFATVYVNYGNSQEVSFQLVSKFICVNFLFLLNICKAESQRDFFVF